jgi:signal transduction histidine kinase
MRLLIVDDNESIHRDFKKILEVEDHDRLKDVELELFGEPNDDKKPAVPLVKYEIDDAYQGEEAVRMANKAAEEGRPYAVIFMDVRMPPGMDGIKATKAIWENHPEIEMVICTAHSDYSWSQMLDEIGASDKLQFVRKPFDMVSIQQLALSLTRKWELFQKTKEYIDQLEVEINQRQKAEEELKELNEQLEDKVSLRTAELSKANEELKQALIHLKTAQEQLVSSEKMAALGGLVAGVAHEINTPVGVGVTAASHLLEKTKTIQGQFSDGTMKKSSLQLFLDTCGEATDMILSNLDRASNLINSFKKVAVDQSSEERRLFKVKEYIQEVMLSLMPKFKKTQHKIVIEGDDEISIDSYPGAFSQVISNLIMNSLIHAFEPEESGLIEINVSSEGSGTMITYRDNGKGIPPDNLKKIFDPFFTTRRGEGGSGLGMHIVYNIATQTLGGAISVDSEEGVGTTFSVYIPSEVSDESS